MTVSRRCCCCRFESQEQKRIADLKKKNLPLFSLPSLLPNRPKAEDVRSDGSFKFPKPWEK